MKECQQEYPHNLRMSVHLVCDALKETGCASLQQLRHAVLKSTLHVMLVSCAVSSAKYIAALQAT